MKIMIDTNVLISAAIFPNKKMNSLIDALTEGHTIVLTDYIIDEINRVTEEKFPTKVIDTLEFLEQLPYELVTTRENINRFDYPQIRDFKDLPILTAAMDSDIDLIITGDKDFSGLDINSPKVMTPTTFMDSDISRLQTSMPSIFQKIRNFFK